MKNFAKRLVIILTLVVSFELYTTPRAQAFACFTQAGGCDSRGLLFAVGGLAGGVGLITLAFHTDGLIAGPMFLNGLYIALFGVVILDQQSGASSFLPIPKELAHKAGLTRDEQNSFNQNLEELSAINEDVLSKYWFQNDIEGASKAWNENLTYLPETTKQAIQKLLSYAMSVKM